MIATLRSLRVGTTLLLFFTATAIVPAQPFPPTLAETVSHGRIAPGLRLARYRFVTSSGPIHAAVLAFDPHDTRLALVPLLAHHALVGKRERLSSMLAEHPRAVAAVNGDYFAIAGNGAPIGGLVRNAMAIRSPYPRAMFSIDANGDARIGNLALNATISFGATTLPLTAIDRREPNGATLFQPSYGALPVLPDATLLALQPLAGSPPFATYRVLDTADNLRANAPGYYLAYGLDAETTIGLPAAGTTLQISGAVAAPGEPVPIRTAFGGGPMFLQDGAYREDPEGPNGRSFSVPIPTTAIGITASGRVLVVEIDGKNPHYSIGVTRRELAAFMLALGARDAMALDGGGSSVMLARTLGSTNARILGHPSDGVERRIAEGIAIESTAPVGLAEALAVRPQRIRALVGVRVAVRGVRVDDALHALGAARELAGRVEPASLGTFADGTFVARTTGRGVLLLHDGTLRGRVTIDVLAEPASLTIHPRLAAASAGVPLRLRAVARDARGARIALPANLPWQAFGASIDASGELLAGNADATVHLAIGGSTATRTVRVGSRSVPLHLASIARFYSVPAAETGSVAPARTGGGIDLFYDFRGAERAAFALLEQPLPAHSIALTFDVRSPGEGGVLRVALRDARNDDVLLTAERLDRLGEQSLRVVLPPTAMPPLRLTGIYIVRALGPGATNRSAGKIELSNLRAQVAGSPPEEP